MNERRFLETDHHRAQRTITQPEWHRAAQHTRFGAPVRVFPPAASLATLLRPSCTLSGALARHHDDQPRPVALRPDQESVQRRVGLGLGHAVEVEHCLDRNATTGNPALVATIEPG